VTVRAMAVVIPAHDEETLLPAALDCVAAAAGHPELADVRVLTIVVADLCRDGTADVARRAGAAVVTTGWRNPGRARAVGADRALELLGARGLPGSSTWLAATDADSRVPPHWLAFHRRRALEGWDAVIGTVELPDSPLAARHRVLYESSRPPTGAAWNHPHVHGANLGVTAAAYRDVGGFPPLDVGEDRALVAALERDGRRVLRTAECPVLTSTRLHARARGGFAAHLAGLPTAPTGTRTAEGARPFSAPAPSGIGRPPSGEATSSRE
jgi:glycosyltransferase involved in cell wall biosynthesis